MSREFVRSVLKDEVLGNVAPGTDLWPGIQSMVEQMGTVSRINPRTSRVSRLHSMGMPKLAWVAASTMLLVLGFGLFYLFGGKQPPPASAAELLARAESVSGLTSFHGIYISDFRNSSREGYGHTTEEQWYRAPDSLRKAASVTTAAGRVITMVYSYNGNTAWTYKDDGTSKTVRFMSAWDSRPTFGAARLQDMLANSLGIKGIYESQMAGTEEFGGRQAYVVDLRMKPQEHLPPDAAPNQVAHLKLWVDSQFYYLLGMQGWDANGNELVKEGYERMEFNPQVDPKLFSKAPPADAEPVP